MTVAMYRNPHGTLQASVKMPDDEYEKLEKRADRNYRSLTGEAMVLLKQSLDQTTDPVGSAEHPWPEGSTRLTMTIKEEQIGEEIREIVAEEPQSPDQEIKHRIIDQLNTD